MWSVLGNYVYSMALRQEALDNLPLEFLFYLKKECQVMFKKLLLVLLLAVLSVSLIGCQTVSGFGGDIQWTAQATSDLLEGN
jgi:predicted small secreted protein